MFPLSPDCNSLLPTEFTQFYIFFLLFFIEELSDLWRMTLLSDAALFGDTNVGLTV